MMNASAIALNRNPWLSAILNFVLPGAGYIYNGVRRDSTQMILGLLIFVVYLDGFLQFFGIIVLTSGSTYATVDNAIITDLIYVIMPIGFAYDGYKRARSSHAQPSKSLHQFCVQCGSELPQAAIFCASCGNKAR